MLLHPFETAIKKFLAGLGIEAPLVLRLMAKDRAFAARIAERAKKLCGIPADHIVAPGIITPPPAKRPAGFWESVSEPIVHEAMFNFIIALGTATSTVFMRMLKDEIFASRITGFAKYQGGLYDLVGSDITLRRAKDSVGQYVRCQAMT